MRKRRTIHFLVAGYGHRAMLKTKTLGGAVAQFRRLFDLPGESTKFDRETGGWRGIHVDRPTARKRPASIRPYRKAEAM
jgi:hypothetical protein